MNINQPDKPRRPLRLVNCKECKVPFDYYSWLTKKEIAYYERRYFEYFGKKEEKGICELCRLRLSGWIFRPVPIERVVYNDNRIYSADSSSAAANRSSERDDQPAAIKPEASSSNEQQVTSSK